jgi:hypothetical protein
MELLPVCRNELSEEHVAQLTAAGDRPLLYPHAYLSGSPRRR